jgi:glycosyltransferase involved in cell wall biosynthesis
MLESSHAAAAPTVSVVIPCYRSGPTLPNLVGQLVPVLASLAPSFEIILVVDGSPDDTWAVASDLAANPAAQSGSVQALRLSRNYGQVNALLAGIRRATGDVIVTMDDDLQHRPDQLPALLAALTPAVDLVYGFARVEEHGYLRSSSSRLTKAVIGRGLGVPHANRLSALRAFRTGLREGLAGIGGPHTSLDVAFSWVTTRVATIEVEMDTRAEGASNYTLKALVAHAISMFLGYSTAPLRIVGYFGMVTGLVGLGILGYVLWAYFSGTTTVPGFTSVTSMIAIFSGAQMITLSVVGEYLARMYARGMGRPDFVVSETVATRDRSTSV